MSLALLSADFPDLAADGWQETSPQDPRYNCIAFAADDTTRRWWPVLSPFYYWPPGAPKRETLAAFVAAYGTRGYVPCPDGNFDAEMEKVVIYCDADGVPTHAARQVRRTLDEQVGERMGWSARYSLRS